MAKLEEIIRGTGDIQELTDPRYRYKKVAGRVECKDGTTLSVQASRTCYCTPRDDYGPYTHVEVGYPDVAPPDSWARYFDGEWGEDDPTGTVYGYVPIELVRDYVESHGGEA